MVFDWFSPEGSWQMPDAPYWIQIHFEFWIHPSKSIKIPGNYQGFWPMNLHTSPSFNVGGGEGDHNSGGF